MNSQLVSSLLGFRKEKGLRITSINFLIVMYAILFSCTTIQTDTVVINEGDVVSPTTGQWLNRIFYDDGEVGFSHSCIALCPVFFQVHKGDLVISTINNHRINVFEYSEPNASSFIKNGGWGPYPNYLSVTFPTGCYEVENDGYIRVQMRHTDPNNITQDIAIDADTFSDGFKVIHKTSNLYEVMRKKSLYHKAMDESTDVRISNDGTFIGDNIWLFGASEEYVDSSYGLDNKVHIYNVNSGEVTQKIHNLGHSNCVDYNPNSKVLLISEVKGHIDPGSLEVNLLLFKNPEMAVELNRNDALIIPLFNKDRNQYIFAQFVFGDSDDILLGFEYGFYGKRAFKIQLGQGFEDYSVGENGFGTIISNPKNDEYNGTARLLMEYSGIIREGIDTEYVINSSYIPGAQGMCYDGNLFLGWGTLGGKSILEIELNDEERSFRVINNHCVSFFNSEGEELSMEPEAIMVKDKRLFAGFRNANTGNFSLISFLYD